MFCLFCILDKTQSPIHTPGVIKENGLDAPHQSMLIQARTSSLQVRKEPASLSSRGYSFFLSKMLLSPPPPPPPPRVPICACSVAFCSAMSKRAVNVCTWSVSTTSCAVISWTEGLAMVLTDDNETG